MRNNYNITYNDNGWVMVETADDMLFDHLYEQGYQRIVLYHQLSDGSWAYIIGKDNAKLTGFPVGPATQKGTILSRLQTLEPGWEGNEQYAGAPVETDGSRSMVTPQELIYIINQAIASNEVDFYDDHVFDLKKQPLRPQLLFHERIHNYHVDTTALGRTRYVNLDNAATTPPFASVEQAVYDYLSSYGSVHRGAGEKSQLSTTIYEESRDIIKNFVGAPKDAYVMFCGNTTGAMNMAAYFMSFLDGKVAVSEIEHSSSWLPWVKTEGIKRLFAQGTSENIEEDQEQIQALGRVQVVQYGLNADGEFDLADIEKLFEQHTIKALVLTAASNLTGYSPDIAKIGEIVHKHGAYFIVDACQFVQHHPIDMQAMGIDFLAASGHKFYAPYGEGFLIGPKKLLDQLLPYQIGGGNLPYITKDGTFLRYQNQLAHDPGTPNAVGAVAMAMALKQLQTIGLENVADYELGLTKAAFDRLANIDGVKLLVDKKHLSTVIPFVVEGVEAEEVARQLNDRFGIGVRAGSFCVYNVVRSLLDVDDEADIVQSVKRGESDMIPKVIRASFSLANTPNDVDRLVDALHDIAKGVKQ